MVIVDEHGGGIVQGGLVHHCGAVEAVATIAQHGTASEKKKKDAKLNKV